MADYGLMPPEVNSAQLAEAALFGAATRILEQAQGERAAQQALAAMELRGGSDG